MFNALEWLIRFYLGKPNDTGGSATAGTVSAKSNNIQTLIGAANNTGGTTTSGTLMAKQNAILASPGLNVYDKVHRTWSYTASENWTQTQRTETHELYFTGYINFIGFSGLPTGNVTAIAGITLNFNQNPQFTISNTYNVPNQNTMTYFFFSPGGILATYTPLNLFVNGHLSITMSWRSLGNSNPSYPSLNMQYTTAV